MHESSVSNGIACECKCLLGPFEVLAMNIITLVLVLCCSPLGCEMSILIRCDILWEKFVVSWAHDTHINLLGIYCADRIVLDGIVERIVVLLSSLFLFGSLSVYRLLFIQYAFRQYLCCLSSVGRSTIQTVQLNDKGRKE